MNIESKSYFNAAAGKLNVAKGFLALAFGWSAGLSIFTKNYSISQITTLGSILAAAFLISSVSSDLKSAEHSSNTNSVPQP
jgi:hypothetical protein